VVCNERQPIFARAEARAQQLGWQEGPAGGLEPQAEELPDTQVEWPPR
jgi:hypothetical protein